MIRVRAVLSLLTLLWLPGAASAQATLQDVTAETVFSGLENPVWVTSEPGGALSITLLPGLVLRTLPDGTLDPAPVLDLQDRVRGGGGLNSVAFHPQRPWLFAHFSETGTDDLVVSRFELEGDPPRAVRASEAELLRLPKFPLHYGGQLAFGPDGMLWLSTGDGTMPGSPDPQCAAQDLQSLEGKLLRLDVEGRPDQSPFYAIPADNPFVAQPGADEIWGFGLRNSWRFSFDREDGELLVSDVGEDQREEVNRVDPSSDGGVNFGWKRFEGSRCFPNTSGCDAALPPCGSPAYRMPWLEYNNAGGRCAVIGGFVYRGRLVPALYGRYVYGDLCSGEIWAADEAGATETLPVSLPGLFSFGEDQQGELYAMAGGNVVTLRDSSLPTGGLVELVSSSIEVREDDGVLLVEAVRLGGGSGPVEGTARLHVEVVALSALPGVDFVPAPVELEWAAGEQGIRSAPIVLLDDQEPETLKTLELVVTSVEGDVRLGARDRATVTLRDDDPCSGSDTRLCLGEGRFRIEVTWRDGDDNQGSGNAVSLGPDSGSFWFFSDNNPEIFVKVLDACGGFGAYWVFAAGLTDVETTLRVLDTASGQERVYERPLGESYEAVRDTAAFQTCP
ncbi:MAG: hypothetical protein DWQ36_08770 [Acidobacteria bacterium]|nr:MAG: hypothetical protein DWQ30_04265 [Acidobacteriota bacterium]REK08734.1 MAG: hypothetical protein DWQ36_08770 [Acidobacteriota bacterium]